MIRAFLALAFALAAASLQAQSDREARGRVVGPRGEPVTNAVLQVRAVTRESGTRYGDSEGFGARINTDAQGEFVIRGREPFRAVTVTAESPDFAKGVFTELASGETIHELKLVEGVAVVGRVVQNNLPAAGVKLGISQTDAQSKIFTTDLRAETDADGVFRIAHLPPKRNYWLYGFMTPRGLICAQRIVAGATGTTVDVGELAVERGFVLEGQIHPPQRAEVILGRDGPPDTQRILAAQDGRFRFERVPGEVISLSAKIPRHRLALQNASLDPLQPDRLLGRLSTNKSGLILQFEPGEMLAPLKISPAAARAEPLGGAESPSDGLGKIRVSAHVFDEETKEPIPQFVVTEGRYNLDEGFDWLITRRQFATNGAFTTHLRTNDSRPALVFEADGYLPWTSRAITDASDLAVPMRRGIQVAGQVIKPNGAPAANVLVRLTDQFSNLVISQNSAESSGGQTTHADAEGRFKFGPNATAFSVFISDTNGFASARAVDVLKSGRVQLLPWGRVEGTLRIGSKPAANESVVLQTVPVPFEWAPRELPAFNYMLLAQTDSNGHFVFEQAPPMLLEIAHALNTPAPFAVIPISQTKRIELAPGSTSTIKLGGQGRVVIGRFEIDSPSPIAWSEALQSVELILTNSGPSDSVVKSLLNKLQESSRAKASPAERAAAEIEYQRERSTLTGESQKFFATDAGRAALRAQSRYYMVIAEDGFFRIDDVPPGRYKISLRVLDPLRSAFRQTILADFATEFTVPDETKNAPIDLGALRIPLPAKK
jgi:hypothetical protein